MNFAYGSKDWFEQKFTQVDGWGDRWGHRIRATQQVRLDITATAIADILRASAKRGGRFLDVGCGLGDFLMRASSVVTTQPDSSNKISFYGCDISENAIIYDQTAFPDMKFQVNALPELNYPSAFFDVISALEVVNYLTEAQQERALDQISKCLGEGGTFLFSGVINDGDRYFTETGVERLIGARFTIHAKLFHNAWPYNAVEKYIFAFVTLSRIYFQRDLSQIDFLTSHTTLRSILKNPAIARVMFGLSVIFQKLALRLVSSQRLYKATARISAFLLRKRSRTHMIVIARKKS